MMPTSSPLMSLPSLLPSSSLPLPSSSLPSSLSLRPMLEFNFQLCSQPWCGCCRRCKSRRCRRPGSKNGEKNSGFSRHILVNKLNSCCFQRRCGFRRRRRCRCRRSWCGWCWCWPIARIEQTSFHQLFLSPSPPLITNPPPMDRKEVRISTSWKCTFHNWITSTHSSYTAGLKYRHCEFL